MSIQTLYSAATGMTSLETKLDVIANNLANMETTAFKCDRVNFEDLFYRHETMPLFGLDSYYEFLYASWNGPDHAEAVGLARGIRLAGTADEYLSLTGGLSRISRTTSNLGQPFEFYGRLAYEKNAGRALFSMGWIHYSDAKFLFGWSGPNNSENFVTLSLGIIF